MPTSYPAALDHLARPGPSAWMDDPGYEGDIVIDNISDAIEAIEAKLGIGGAAPGGTAAVLRRTGVGVSAWGQVEGGDIATNAISTGHIADRGIASADLALGCVTAAELADGAVTSAKILDGTIATADLAAGAISQYTQSGTGAGQSTTSGTQVAISGATMTLTTTGGFLFVVAAGSVYSSSVGAQSILGLSLDGAATGVGAALTTVAVNANTPWTVGALYLPTAGSRTVTLRWQTNAGTLTMNNGLMYMVELKK